MLTKFFPKTTAQNFNATSERTARQFLQHLYKCNAVKKHAIKHFDLKDLQK